MSLNIYCAHLNALPYGPHGYMHCGLCASEWYSIDPAPIVVIGVTSPAEIERYPFQKENND